MFWKKKEGSFFHPVDWAAFWAATLVSFIVYFLTLGPSVTLEDCGELAVAGDWLGVPHPPGYPIWTICAFLFARLFSWVTFQGQPTPAFAISLMSGVFGALAAGLTAMLITRSASDLLANRPGAAEEDKGKNNTLFCWAGGVAGSLCFAFSPVMWSQATIVEVYSLNAFFLMWIFLLTYRWMRKPSDKILWLTAFVFGLGLTNYQVLLLAMIPLVVVVFLRDITLFRDFILVGIPILLTGHALQIGSETAAAAGMVGPAYAKLAPVVGATLPSKGIVAAGAVLFFAGLVASLVPLKEKLRRFLPLGLMLGAGVLILFAGVAGSELCTVAPEMPLAKPSLYTLVAGLLCAIVALSVTGAASCKESWKEASARPWLYAAGGAFVLLLVVAGSLKGAEIPQGYIGAAYNWFVPGAALLGGIAVLFMLAVTVPKGMFYAIPVAAVQCAVFILLRKGAMHGLTHPTLWWFWWPVCWNFAIMLLAWLALPHGKTVAITTFFAELGVSFYAYMPIVSDLRNPPMNWGYPRTWEGFKHAITRGQYEKIAPSDIFDGKMLKQLGFYFTDLRVQYTLIAAVLGFLPFTLWSVRWKTLESHAKTLKQKYGYTAVFFGIVLLFAAGWLSQSGAGTALVALVFLLHFAATMWGAAAIAGGKRLRGVSVAAAFYLVVSALVLASEVVKGEPVLRLDKFLIADIFLLLAVGGISIVFEQVWSFAERTWKGRDLSEGMTAGVSLAGCAAVAVVFLAKGLVHAFGGETATALVKVAAVAAALALVGGGLFAMWKLRGKAQKEFEFRYDADNVSQQWLIATAAGFFVMSVLLVVLANVKGDLQDSFIQKVKFISSHGLFAIWIGYGLVFGLIIAREVFGKFFKIGRRTEIALAVCCLCAAGIPIYENYCNDWVAFALGGAEQNGHDYGWQFGNYQLRGAKAITEELDANEEPLPNPLYPREMGQGAIFFGGTDPGRFVPTYMIYSADVRPDVYLITQNALADNTYMAVMRDLYGDDIWIPTPEDSAQAFQIYVDEVNSGKRPQNASLTIENGRVQVSGALGVMEINGILCDMIFKKNKNLHEFFIEESYVIQWMFPYLTPNGLIMRINPEPTAIDTRTRINDMDFWDWYSRRLVKSLMFRRDVPGQKSFSKLRSAIAGLYASRGMFEESEKAFQEARVLYPVSPEANFRLIQEILLQQARYDEAVDILTDYNRRDPNNERGPNFLRFVENVKAKQHTISTLHEKLLREKQLSANEMLEFASAHREMGSSDVAAKFYIQTALLPGMPPQKIIEIALTLHDMKRDADAIKALAPIESVLGKMDLSAEVLWEVVLIYGAEGEFVKAGPLLVAYLKKKPHDWQAWLNLAVVYEVRGQSAEAQYAITQALSFGRDNALKSIQASPQLRQIAAPVFRQMQSTRQGGMFPAAPGM